jgi:hypothetical protein
VSYGGRCYYLDGVNGSCLPGCSPAAESILGAIAGSSAGLNYRTTISDNCCIVTSSSVENYGMTSHCNASGPFSSGEPTPGGAGCTGATSHSARQLTFCGSN